MSDQPTFDYADALASDLDPFVKAVCRVAFNQYVVPAICDRAERIAIVNAAATLSVSAWLEEISIHLGDREQPAPVLPPPSEFETPERADELDAQGLHFLAGAIRRRTERFKATESDDELSEV